MDDPNLNPRQFSSLDNLPASSFQPSERVPVYSGGHEVTLDQLFKISERVTAIQKSNGTYVQPSYEKRGGRAQEYADEEGKRERDARFRQRVRESKAAQEIAAAREQAARAELWSKIKGDQWTPHISPTETPLQTAHRLMRLPPPVEGQPPSALPPPSTPERQPLPSRGSPPPTPNGTAARASALVEPTATPSPAMLKEAIATTAQNAISALPRALPQAAGRLVIPGVGAGLSIGARLIVGQSITQAVTSTGAGLVGTGIGAIIGTAIGGVVGGMIGGTAASLCCKRSCEYWTG